MPPALVRTFHFSTSVVSSTAHRRHSTSCRVLEGEAVESGPGKPDLHVAEWVCSQDEESLFLSMTTIGEIQKGISKLPDSRKKKQQLKNRLNNELQERFKDRILEITIGTAYAWGQVLGACEKKGVILPAIDCLIAS